MQTLLCIVDLPQILDYQFHPLLPGRIVIMAFYLVSSVQSLTYEDIDVCPNKVRSDIGAYQRLTRSVLDVTACHRDMCPLK